MSQLRLTWVPPSTVEQTSYQTDSFLTFVATDQSGHSLVLDASVQAGGADTGFRPVDLVMIALAGCAAMDIVSILRKKRTDLRWFRAEISGERAAEHPRRLVHIQVRFVANQEVGIDNLQRAMELSRDKYCSVAGTLRNSPELSFEVQTL